MRDTGPHATDEGGFRGYVMSLSPRRSPSAPAFEAVLDGLRPLLVFELRRRGLWSTPPRYLGIFGGERWADPAVLDELVLDCYAYVFVDRLRGLRRQAAVRPSIDGLVTLSVRHFVHDAQRRHDPLGYRVFELTHEATGRLVERGVLHVLAGDERIRNHTLLGFDDSAAAGDGQAIDPSWIEAWNDRLMPDLVTAWHRGRVVEVLTTCIGSLAEAGVRAFPFRDLVAPLKDGARRQWRALASQDLEQGGSAEGAEHAAGLVAAPVGFEQRQQFRALSHCIRRRIAAASLDDAQRQQLVRMFEVLIETSAALEEGTPPPLPSSRGLAVALDLSRRRTERLRSTLEGMAAGCVPVRGRAPVGTHETTSDRPNGHHDQEIAMASGDSKRHLRALTRAALDGEAHDSDRSGPPRAAGDVMIVGDDPLAVEWLWLDGDADRARLVPVDQAPFEGPVDVEIEDDAGVPWWVRPGHVADVSGRVLAGAACTTTLSTRDLNRVRKARARAEDGPIEVVASTEQRAWSTSLDDACRRLARSAADAPVPVPGEEAEEARPLRWRRAPVWLTAAAALLAVVLAGLWMQRLGRSVERAQRPTLVASTAIPELRVGALDRAGEVDRFVVDGDRVSLYLVLRDLPTHPQYRLRTQVLGDATTAWVSPVFGRADQQLTLPVADEPRRWELTVWGVDEGGAETVLETRILVIVPSSTSR